MRLPIIPARIFACFVYCFLPAAALLLALPAPALSASYTWVGNSGVDTNWSTATNWNPPTGPPGDGDSVVFDVTTANDLNLDVDTPNVNLVATGNVGSHNINGGSTFNTSGIDCSGNTSSSRVCFNVPVNLTGPATFDGGLNRAIYFYGPISNAGHTLTAQGYITFYGGLSGGGGLVLDFAIVNIRTQPATYTGPTVINNLSEFYILQTLASTSYTFNGICVIGLYASDVLPDTASISLANDSWFYLSGRNETIDTLSGTGLVITGGGALTVGANNGSSTFSGVISDSGGLTKTGTGTFTLAGANTYTGATTINGGTLRLGGNERLANASSMVVAAGATFDLNGFNETIANLSGTGTVDLGGGNLAITTSLNPGSSPGGITFLGNFNLAVGTLNVEIDGTNPGADYDQVNVTGTVTLGGNLNLIPTISPAAGATFTIIDNDGADAVIGTFAGLAEGATITSGGAKYRISYTGGTGNDVTLTSLGPVSGGGSTPTPEPEPTPDPPAAPQVSQGSGPSPTGSLNGPSLSWPHVSGSNFYRIYRAACPTCPKQQVGRVPGTSFMDESAQPGQVYYYFIRTENPGGLSDYSDWLPAWRYEQNPGRAGDFNGDGVMDLLWWDPDTGELSIWYLNSGAVQSVGSPGQGLDIGQWLLVNTGDFNNDGVWDLLWWNPETGAAAIWYLTATASASGGMGLRAADQAGDITGNVTLSYSGDLNGDGRSDLVWRDYASGEVTLWLMGSDGKPALNGPPSLAEGMADSGRPGVTGSLAWALRGAQDLNGDGKADLVWQHATDGRVVVWLMDGSQAMGFLEYQRSEAANWRVAGLGDLDGDGRGDLLWRNDADGRLRAWLMTGGDPAYEEWDIALSGGDAAAWQVKAVGSFCRVGCAEAYCKHAESGAARIVNLDGGEFDLAVE